MIHAYNKIYTESVMYTLSALFDIAINVEGLTPDDFANNFANSSVASAIECGNPNYLAGKSATELLSLLLNKQVEYTKIPIDRSPEYWAGWILSYAQWYLNKSFSQILSVIPFSHLIAMYNPYHEAADLKTVELIQKSFSQVAPLKQIRKLRKLSQKELSLLSGVKLRSIQCYEQGDNDIGKAQAETLFALAKTLDCSIEDLLN